MSVAAIKWARGVRTGDGPAKAILWVLADAADEHGYCFLGHQSIAERADLKRRCVGLKLQHLETLGLITRSRRSDGSGHRTSDHIQLNLAALGAQDALRKQEVQSVQDAPRDEEPKRTTGRAYAHDRSSLSARGAQEAISEATREAKEGGGAKKKPPLKAEITALVEAIWSITPKASRERSSRSDLTTAVEGAFKRGRSAADMKAGLEGYFRSEGTTKDGGKFAKGVHRMIERDRFEEFIPQAVVSVPRSPDEEWRSRLKRHATSQFWDTTDWGPLPGKLGCLAPVPMLAEFGHVSGVTPLQRATA